MNSQIIRFFLGVDVQIKRKCSYFILNQNLEQVDSGWLQGFQSSEICSHLLKIINNREENGAAHLAIGIDAPRIPLSSPRKYFWKGSKWIQKTSREKGLGRHCEVVIKALNIGNPQWTPLKDKIPAWMQLGFDLFEHLKNRKHVFEVFPSAAYKLLEKKEHPKVLISFNNFIDGPKDMLDACVSAFTVHQYLLGHGSEVGGGDRMGTIILPTSLPVPYTHPVLK